MIDVHLLSHVPPPYGGVNVWTQHFIDHAPAYELAVTLQSIGASEVRDVLRWHARVKRVGRGFFAPLQRLFVGPQRNADVLHVCVSGGLGFWRGLALVAVAAAQKKRAILHLHSRATTCDATALRVAHALTQSDHVTVVTPSAQDARHWAFLRHIDHFISPQFGALNRWPGTTAGPLRLVYMGSMIREKGLFDLLQALPRARDITLDCYGPVLRPTDLQRWQQQAAVLNLRERVRYQGLIDHAQVPATLCRYDALIVPSHDESFGLAAAEAMHLGVPVIATPVGFLWNTPAECFVTLPLQQPASWGATLADIAAHKTVLIKIADAGRKYVIDRFDTVRAMDSWRQLYNA